MDYKKEYVNVLMRAEEAVQKGCLDRNTFDAIFSELAESEDERIRKVIHKILLGLRKEIFTTQDEVVTKDKALAYLEKQKEQEHPEGCFTCDEYKKGYEAGRLNGFTAGYNKAIKEQKPAEWSEEDESKLNHILEIVHIVSGREASVDEKEELESFLKSLCPSWNCSMIQWTGKNLREVIDFTGKSPKFNEWFKSWDEFESYVHSHGDIVKLFGEDGSYYEVPVGAWIIKTPDGYNIPSHFKFIQKSSWKPSEEQMEALLWCTAHLGGADHRVLAELYEHLKKL